MKQTNKNTNKTPFKENFKKWYDYYFKRKKPILDNPNLDKDAVLEVVNLSKKYSYKGRYIINNLNFKVLKGQFHAFIGGNGAGKTTTMKSLVGAYTKFDGDVYLSGISNRLAASKKKIGYIPEIARFPEGLSTFDYLFIMASLSGVDKETATKYINDKLTEFNMIKLAKKSPNDFSSGQKKKILLIQALVHDPELLIMDEPAANLDPIARDEFFKLLKQLQHQGKAIFISSHILSELDKFADSATVLDGGKIVFTGEINKHDNLYLLEVNMKSELLELLNSKSIEYYYNEFNELIVTTTDIEFLKSLLLKNIITGYHSYKKTLQEIYNENVIKGSIETAKEN